MKRLLAAVLCWAMLGVVSAQAEETVIEPAWPVPDEVTWLLEVAGGEVGYREGDHGYSKYGEWAGDPYAQWCAEFLGWCVDQVDQQHGTHLLNEMFPLYSGSNTGRSWFVKQGRYVVRWGYLDDWGYQWLKGSDRFLTTGDYIPQPGDWVFFTWTETRDTDHVALVEYCTRDGEGNVSVHVIEGNNPVSVQRNVYALTYKRILGYGTVHDAVDVTLRYPNVGEKVRALQEKLCYLGYLAAERVDGTFGNGTADAVRLFQKDAGFKQNGIANITTQHALNAAYEKAVENDPATWLVVDDEE